MKLTHSWSLAVASLLVSGLLGCGNGEPSSGGNGGDPSSVAGKDQESPANADKGEEPSSPAELSAEEKITGTLSKPGRVRVTVTWEYNKYVGNRPDTDATVTLIPKGYSRKVDVSLDPMFARISFDTKKQILRDEGVYAGIVGGDGKTLIADVPAGSYTMIIISKNTNDHPDVAKLTERQLERYFKVGSSARVHKVHITDITVPSGEETEYSHDFGNTYF